MTNKKIHREIELEYDRLKNKSEREYNERMDRIYSAHPRLRDISAEINGIGARIAKAILLSDEKQRAYNTDKLEKLKSEKAEYMKKHGITDYDLARHYECENCRDTGYLKDGSKCQCRLNRLAEYAYDNTTIARILKKENFDSFDIERFSDEKPKSEQLSSKENMKELKAIAEKFIAEFDDENTKSLLFYGPPGQGKTFLANCIADELIKREKSVIYQTAHDFVEALQAVSFKSDIVEDDLIKADMIKNCDLLIIDDLGTELQNTFTVSELFNIINTRILNGKKMLISTNLNPTDIRNIYSDRIYSRIFSSFIMLRFYGRDQRY